MLFLSHRWVVSEIVEVDECHLLLVKLLRLAPLHLHLVAVMSALIAQTVRSKPQELLTNNKDFIRLLKLSYLMIVM